MTKRNVKAKTARKAKTVSAYVHFPVGSSPYHGVTGDNRQVLICAAMVAAGFAKLNKANIGKDAKPNARLFKAIVGDTPLNYHRRAGRMTADGLSAEGLKWFQHRINSEDRMTLVREMAGAMAKGGEAGGLKFSRKVAVDA